MVTLEINQEIEFVKPDQIAADSNFDRYTASMEVLLAVATHLIIDDESTTISSNDKHLYYDMMIVNDKLNIFIPIYSTGMKTTC